MIMKKIIKPIIIVIALTAIALYLYFSNTKGTIRKELKDFVIEDTASITKVFMVDKNNKSVTLERKENYWTANKDFIARKDLVDVLLKTICRLNVKAPVARSSHNVIVSKLASTSTKVEIYQNDKLTKTYYVGGATPDNMGTYMLLDQSSVPFIMDIPGFTGYLTTRFSTEITEWKDRAVFRYKFADIANITVENPTAPSQSFKAINYGNNKFGLKSLKDNKDFENFDTLSLKEYIGYFKNLSFESFVSNIPQARRDSVFKSIPLLIITVENKSREKQSIRMYLRPNYEKEADEKSNETFPWDVNRMYGFINNDKDMVIIQYFVFDPIIKEAVSFQKKHR